MAIGHTGYLIECQTSSSYAMSVAPCVSMNGAHYQPVIVHAYIVEAAAASTFNELDQPFDYGAAAEFWAWGFIGVATFWLIGLLCSKVLEPMWR